MKQHWRKIIFLTTWVVLLGAGFWRLFIYANTPGSPAQVHLDWPSETKIARKSELPSLLVFTHPHCPCSEASIGELERLMPHIKGKVKPTVVFYKPKNRTDGWVKEKLWNKAKAIPDVEVMLDEDGVESARFGAQTSGQVLLYGKDGKLVFRGGITPARGHMGDNDGRSTILAYVATGDSRISTTPVFGCSLKNPERSIAGSKER